MVASSSTQGERLARMEVEVTELKKAFEEHKEETNKRFDRIEGKLDALLELRNKGAGVFWFISVVVGSSVIGGLLQLVHWFRS